MDKVKRENLIRKITKGGDNFIVSKWSLIIFIGMVVVSGIINYILFGLEITPVKSPFLSPYIDEGKIWVSGPYQWLGWLSMTLSFVGSVFNIWGFVLITRMDKKFIFPILIGGILSIPNEIFVGAIFSGICFIFLISVEVWTWLQWRKEDQVSNTKATKKHYITLAIIWVVFITVGLSISLSIEWFHADSYFVPIMDVLGSSIVLVCWSLALLKNKWALLALVFNDSIYISLYIFQGVYAMSVTFLVYMSMNFIGFLGWSSKEQEEKSRLLLERDMKPLDEDEDDKLIFR